MNTVSVSEVAAGGLVNTAGRLKSAGLVGFECGVSAIGRRRDGEWRELVYPVFGRANSDVRKTEALRYAVTLVTVKAGAKFAIDAPDGHKIGAPFFVDESRGLDDTRDREIAHMTDNTVRYDSLVGRLGSVGDPASYNFALLGKLASSGELAELDIDTPYAELMVNVVANVLDVKLQRWEPGDDRFVTIQKGAV